MSEAEARLLIEDCMRTMFYRDKKAHDNIQISTVTFDGGVQINEPYKLQGAAREFQFYYNRTNEYWLPVRIDWIL